MIYYIIIFLFGITVGSFLNVCIYRIPLKEDIVFTPSHCMGCGYGLQWYDLVPLVSFIVLKGKCRKCHAKLSLQYPIIEAANGILWVLVFLFCGIPGSLPGGISGIVPGFVSGSMTNGVRSGSVQPFVWQQLADCMILCAFFSTLVVISVIDFRTYEIPLGCNIFILVLGCIRLVLHSENWVEYAIGFFAVSTFLLVLYLVTKGRGIGGGDIKLMAVAGLLLGWKLILLAFFIGCILGAVLHILRMKLTKADHVLAFGPYLSMGLVMAALFGNEILNWYLGVFMA